jgi:hypothetical protein
MKKPRFLLLNPHFLIITIITLGTVFAVSTLGQRTSTRQFAAQPKNLNTVEKTKTTLNSDGTMGPKTPSKNFTNELPTAYTGKLQINLAQSQQAASDIQTLKLNIIKAEVHLIHLFLPGTNPKINAASTQKTNQHVNKWETLQLNENAIIETPLAGGKYSEIRIYMADSKAVLKDGREIDLALPGHNFIRITRPFNIYAGQTTNITLQLDKHNSIIKTGDRYILTPFISGMTINEK